MIASSEVIHEDDADYTKALEEIVDNQNEIGAPNEQASKEILKVELIERNFQPDMVSSSTEKLERKTPPRAGHRVLFKD